MRRTGWPVSGKSSSKQKKIEVVEMNLKGEENDLDEEDLN